MNHFGMFAKHWTPGRVKTRLAASIGIEAAADVYQAFVKTLLQNLNKCGDTREVSIVPFEESRGAFAELAAGRWRITPQSSGDLGEKMRCYFDSAFAAGARRVVLIGSDSPLLSRADIHAAFERLKTSDVVLGPTNDGGYYLVGATKTTPPIFDEIEWSTPTVWEQTLANLTAAGVTHAKLPTRIDVDELSDLHQLHTAMSDAGQTSGLLYDAVRRHIA